MKARLSFIAAAAALAALIPLGAAHANDVAVRVDLPNVGIRIGTPPAHYYPAPVVVAPAPRVYYPPVPVYVPAPVYRPYYYYGRPYYGHGHYYHGHGHGYGHYQGRDGYPR